MGRKQLAKVFAKEKAADDERYRGDALGAGFKAIGKIENFEKARAKETVEERQRRLAKEAVQKRKKEDEFERVKAMKIHRLNN